MKNNLNSLKKNNANKTMSISVETQKKIMKFLKENNMRPFKICENKIILEDGSVYHLKLDALGNLSILNIVSNQQIKIESERKILGEDKILTLPKPKTKKGKVKLPNPVIIFPPIIVTLIMTIKLLEMTPSKIITEADILNELNNQTNIEVLEESKEFQKQILDITTEEELIEVPKNESVIDELEKSSMKTETTEISNQVDKNIIFEDQVLNYDFPTSQYGLEKREFTEIYLGDTINKFANRYGFAPAVAKSLITQERPSDKEGYDFYKEVSSERDKEDSGERDIDSKSPYYNIMQFESSICNEPMAIPCVTGDVDFIYVYNENSESQKKRARELESIGYEIFSFQNLKKPVNYENNIRVGLAYITHCFYKCNTNIFKGLRANNGGYPETVKYSNDEIYAGAFKTGDPSYCKNILSYMYPEEFLECYFILKNDGPTRTVCYDTLEKMNILKERMKTAPNKCISLKFPFMEEKYYENQKENGRGL